MSSKEAIELLETLVPAQEVIDDDIITEGKQLLTDVARAVGQRILDEKQMYRLLATMITDTSFASAVVTGGTYQKRDAIQEEPRFAVLSVEMGQRSNRGAYRVWFTRDHARWVLRFNKIDSERIEDSVPRRE